jgi:hypothetical protein
MSISPSAYHEGLSNGSQGQYIPRYVLCVVVRREIVVVDGKEIYLEFRECFPLCAFCQAELGKAPSSQKPRFHANNTARIQYI